MMVLWKDTSAAVAPILKGEAGQCPRHAIPLQYHWSFTPRNVETAIQ